MLNNQCKSAFNDLVRSLTVISRNYENCNLSEHDEFYPFRLSLDELLFDVMVWRDAITDADDRLRVTYDGKEIGRILSNRSMTIGEALGVLGIDPTEMDGNDPVWDFELFDLEY